ncbi:MAG TPA: response regulator [Terriglobia bacterium]|nr:response regulator [Terriglobia bacterium]
MMELRRVLLVDDDRLVLVFFKHILGHAFDPHLAVGADEALDAIVTQGSFPVVISDLRMPEMSGVDLISKVKDSCPETVCVLLSGDVESDEARDAFQRGLAFRLLPKPCQARLLVETVEDAFRQYEASRASSE